MKFANSTLARALLAMPLVRFQKGLRYIFVYHDVSDPGTPQYHPSISTQIRSFEKQIQWLKTQFKLVSLSDIHKDQSDSNCAAIVFDDGFRSVLTNAQPILRSEKVPFTIFINRNAVVDNWLWGSNVFMAQRAGDDVYLKKIYDFFSFGSLSYESFRKAPAEMLISENKLANDYSIFYDEKYAGMNTYLNRSDLHQMFDNSCDVGSHTANHKVLSGCDDSTLSDEIALNANFINELTGTRTEHFAIPFGFGNTFDMRTVELARKYHSRIYSTDRTYFKISPAVAPRIGLRNETVSELKHVVNLPVAVNLRNKLLNR